jgi:hypothetical protein
MTRGLVKSRCGPLVVIVSRLIGGGLVVGGGIVGGGIVGGPVHGA